MTTTYTWYDEDQKASLNLQQHICMERLMQQLRSKGGKPRQKSLAVPF
jgi:hypothetical protein